MSETLTENEARLLDIYRTYLEDERPAVTSFLKRLDDGMPVDEAEAAFRCDLATVRAKRGAS